MKKKRFLRKSRRARHCSAAQLSPRSNSRGTSQPTASSRLPSAVAVDFGPRSFDVRVEGLGGANYRLKIPELYDVVDPDKCKFRVKRDKLVLTLKTGIPVVPFSSWQTLTSGSNSDH